MTEVPAERRSALKDYQDVLPPTFTHERGGKYMLSVLSQRKLWQNRPKEARGPDPILFLNLQSERQYAFDRKTLKTQENNDFLNHGDGFNGVVLVTGPLEEGDTNVIRKLATGISSLKPGASFFLFEKPKGPLNNPQNFVEKNWREETLKKMGLVEVNVLNSGRSAPNAILWEAHMRRDEGLTQPVNLLENGPYYIPGIIGEMRERLKKGGWEVVDFDNSELAKKLRTSKFPLKDIHTIRDGFGVNIRSNLCPTGTCEGVIPIDTGSIILTNSCGEEHSPPEIRTVKNTGAIHENTTHESWKPRCGDFPEHGEMTYDKRRKLFVCPHCASRG